MNKIPPVERNIVLPNCLTGKSAFDWCKFLAEEYDFEGDAVMANMFRAKAHAFSLVMPACVSDKFIEDGIVKFSKMAGREVKDESPIAHLVEQAARELEVQSAKG
jgi:hypothetical protein